MSAVSAGDVRNAFDYVHSSGALVWKVRTSNRVKVGQEAGCVSKADGYRVVSLGGRLYKAHRIIWLHVYGEWPPHVIDHINGDRLDNRLANLRAVTSSENAQNLSLSASNKSGLPGVSWDAGRGRWFSSIQKGGKTYALGRFEDKGAAYRAYLAAKRNLHPMQPVPRAV